MCGGPKTVTSTTNAEPPAYLAGPLRTAANAAVTDFNTTNRFGTYQPYPNPFAGSNLFGGTLERIGQQYADNQPGSFGGGYYGGLSSYQQPSQFGHPAGGGVRRPQIDFDNLQPGDTIQGFGGTLTFDPDRDPRLANLSQGQRDALMSRFGMTNANRDRMNDFMDRSRARIAAQRAASGKDLISQSRGLTGASLGGSFLHPQSNPYLASTFNRAADLTRTRLDSEFAGSGRNLGAALPARSEELQTLASNIFGQNYQAERDRQIQALSQAQELDPINLLINRLAGITPGAGGKTTSTTPIFRTGLF